MVTDCTGANAWNFADAETVFLQGALSFLRLVVPGTLCLWQWRLYLNGRRSSPQAISIIEPADWAEDVCIGGDDGPAKMTLCKLIVGVSATVLTSELRPLIYCVVTTLFR